MLYKNKLRLGEKMASGTSGRSARRFEENEAGLGYVLRLREMGPREGESRLSFEARVASVVRGRMVVLAAWIKHGGDRTGVSRELNMRAHSLTTYLRQYGLSTDILDLELGKDPATKKRNQRLLETALEQEAGASW